jgi:hypothetical protein
VILNRVTVVLCSDKRMISSQVCGQHFHKQRVHIRVPEAQDPMSVESGLPRTGELLVFP